MLMPTARVPGSPVPWRGGAHRRRPDAVPAGRENAVRVDGVLDRLAETAVGVVAEAVLVRGQIHEVQMRAVLAVAVLGRLAHQQLGRVVGTAAWASSFVSNRTIVTWTKLRALIGSSAAV